MITAMYMDCYSSVKTRVGTSEWFKIDTGLKQGSVLSPLLFLIVMDDIMKASMKDYSRAKMKVLLLADDVVIWGEDQMEVQEQLDVINEKIEQWGLKINVEKSKTVVMSRGEKEGKGIIKVGGKEFEVVKHFKYLGSELTEDGRLDLEISRRIQLGSAFYQQVQGLVWNKDIPMKAKEVMYKAYYVPIMTYAAETWTITQRDESRVQAAEMKFLRSMVKKKQGETE